MAITGHIATAEAHAKSCFEALERHCGGRGVPRCGCLRDAVVLAVAVGCETGQMLKEEYEIASRRVRELRETGRIDRLTREELAALTATTKGSCR